MGEVGKWGGPKSQSDRYNNLDSILNKNVDGAFDAQLNCASRSIKSLC